MQISKNSSALDILLDLQQQQQQQYRFQFFSKNKIQQKHMEYPSSENYELTSNRIFRKPFGKTEKFGVMGSDFPSFTALF